MEQPTAATKYFYKRKFTTNMKKNPKDMIRLSTGSRLNTKDQQRYLQKGRNKGVVSMHISKEHKNFVNLSPLKNTTTPVQNKHRHNLSQHRKGSVSGYMSTSYRYKKFQQVNQSQQKDKSITSSHKNPNTSLNNYMSVSHHSQRNKAGNTNSNLSMMDYKRIMRRQQIFDKIKKQNNLYGFLKKVQEKQSQFNSFCQQQNYEKASQVIVDLLNYTVDLNLKYCFNKALRILGDFFLFVHRISQALFYYNQTKQCSILLDGHIILIQSLIGISKCCCKVNLQKQAIIFLKKALQYSWLYDMKQLQMIIYDQIGKRYYHSGQIQKAKKYHQRFINSNYQASTSAHRMLSKQRTLKSHQINLEKKYQELNLLFLIHLKVPLKSLEELPPMATVYLNQKDSHEVALNINNLVRKDLNIDQKYHKIHRNCQNQVKKILKGWFFAEQIQQPSLPQGDWTIPLKLDKYKFIDFKLNQQLKKYTNKLFVSKAQMKSKDVQYKQTLQQKIQRKINQPGLDPDWYQKMLNQIKRDHRNKLLNVRNAVRIRGYNSGNKPSLEIIKDIYHQFFQGNVQH